MKPKVFIAQNVSREVENYIEKYCDYEIWNSDEKIPRDLLLKSIADVDGLIQFGAKIDKELLDAAPKLKVVSNVTVGYDNFDLAEMKKRNIIGTNTPYVLDNTVADLVFALILSTSRRVVELDKFIRDGKWNKDIDKENFGVDVYNKTLGIIGMGRIGEKIAKRGKFGFDMEVIYCNRHRNLEVEEKLDVKYSTFDELLIKPDFIVIMTPLNEETKKLIDYREFNLMKQSSIFINASRGQTVNESALIDALEKNKIRGAGLDVFYKEPIDKDNPLLKMDNVVLLPHIGSATLKTRNEMAMLAAKNMVSALIGEPVPNIVKELKLL
ncbi:2-hydroxyacid dehydrogenase [Clostridium sp. Marseille-QA1073]